MKVIWTIDTENKVITVEPVHGYTVSVGKREVKPHQFDKEYRVECTPEQKAELFSIAKKLGIKTYDERDGKQYPNMYWWPRNEMIHLTKATKKEKPNYNWIPFDEFLSRLKGEWKEKCEDCKGTGEIEKTIYRGEEGMEIEMDVPVVCDECDGSGKIEVTEAHSSLILDDLQHRLSAEALEMANYKGDAQ